LDMAPISLGADPGIVSMTGAVINAFLSLAGLSARALPQHWAFIRPRASSWPWGPCRRWLAARDRWRA
jgi:hypothetical protein